MNDISPYEHHVLVAAMAATAIAAVFDWRKGEIPNWLTYAMLILGPLGHVVRYLAVREAMNYALEEGGYAVGGALLCALVPVLLYRRGAIGGGDVKLLAALGAMLQTSMGIEAEMYGIFAATLIAPAVLAYEGKLLKTIKNAIAILLNFFSPKEKQRPVDEAALSWVRLGPAVFLGVAFTAYLHW